MLKNCNKLSFMPPSLFTYQQDPSGANSYSRTYRSACAMTGVKVVSTDVEVMVEVVMLVTTVMLCVCVVTIVLVVELVTVVRLSSEAESST